MNLIKVENYRYNNKEVIEVIYQARNHYNNRMHLRSGAKVTTKDDAENILNTMGKKGVFWIIEENKVVVGYCGLGNIHEQDRRGELYLVTSPSSWINNIEYELTVGKAIIEEAFNIQNLVDRIDAVVYSYCRNRIELIQKLGFKQEGICRNAHYWGGTWYDEHIFGLLKDDYNETRKS